MANSNIDKDDIKNIQDYNKALADLKKLQDAANKAMSETSAIQKLNDLAKERLSIEKEINLTNDSINKLQEEAKGNDEAILKSLKLEASARVSMLKARERELDIQEAILDTNSDLYKQIQNIKRVDDARQKLAEKYSGEIQKQLGFLDSIDDAIKDIPVVGGMLSKALGADKLKEELGSKLASTLSKKLVPGMGSIATGAEGAAMGMEGALAAAGPLLPIVVALGAAVMLFKRGLEVNQELVDMQRSFGLSAEAAHDLHHSVQELASQTKIVGANTETLMESYHELVGLTGQNVVANKQLLETQVLLKKQYGMTGDEAAAFQSTAISNGKTTEQNLITVKQMTESYNEMTGDSLNFKEITKDIAKVSKTTLATYKGDIKALTMAAIQAKKIGMTLEDTQSVAKSLLSIDTNIQDEMEARVLTGKNINLNEARMLALQGKTAEAAAEAVKQAGSYDEFIKMAPYQQEALAKAAGMTVEQLTKAGEMQKMSEALGGKEIKNMRDLSKADLDRLQAAGTISEEKAKQLATEQQQASVNEKLALGMDRIKAVFAKLIDGPLGSMMEGLSNILDDTEMINRIVGYVSAGFYSIKLPIDVAVSGIRIIWNSLSGIYKLLTGDFAGAWEDIKDIVDSILSPVRTLGKYIGSMKMAITGESGDKDTSKEMHDGVIGPGGKMVVSSPAGAISLNPNDSIVAGTNLFGSGGATSGQPAGNDPQIGEMISLLKQLVAATSGPTVIKIGNKTIEELDSQISLRKNYNIGPDRTYGNRL